MNFLAYNLVFQIKGKPGQITYEKAWDNCIGNIRKLFDVKIKNLNIKYELYLIREISDKDLKHVHGILLIDDTEENDIKMNCNFFGKWEARTFELYHTRLYTEVDVKKYFIYINKDFNESYQLFSDWNHITKNFLVQWYDLRGIYWKERVKKINNDMEETFVDLFLD